MKLYLKSMFYIFICFSTISNPLVSMDKKGISIKECDDVEKTMLFLMQPEQQPFLQNVIKIIFIRDKSELYIEKKMCTHKMTALEPWKTGKKPDEIKSDLWKSMLQRNSLVLFTMNNPTKYIEEMLKDNEIKQSITIKNKGGTQSAVVIIEAIYHIGTKIGEKHETDEFETNKRDLHKVYKNFLPKDLSEIRIEVEINPIIEYIINKKSLPDTLEKTVKLKTVCPTD